jgi:hypothetical protein
MHTQLHSCTPGHSTTRKSHHTCKTHLHALCILWARTEFICKRLANTSTTPPRTNSTQCHRHLYTLPTNWPLQKNTFILTTQHLELSWHCPLLRKPHYLQIRSVWPPPLSSRTGCWVNTNSSLFTFVSLAPLVWDLYRKPYFLYNQVAVPPPPHPAGQQSPPLSSYAINWATSSASYPFFYMYTHTL